MNRSDRDHLERRFVAAIEELANAVHALAYAMNKATEAAKK